MLHSNIIKVAVLASAAFSLAAGPGALIATALIAATVVRRRRRARRDRSRVAEVTGLLAGLEAVIGELRIGAHPSAAAAVAAAETTGEVARAFAVSAACSRLGGSGAEGLRRPGSVVAEELSRVAGAWLVAERHGLSLAEPLAAARLDLLGRRHFRDRTEAALAGARATALVLALLPLLGIGLGQLMGASPLHVLFVSAAGTVLLPLGVALTCAGLLWADAITGGVLR
ncbi:hypothetical protein GCM10027167_33780 [Nocardia heshunensis]